ncbi:fimbria/pilus periplasmic chaperone [Nocardioides sp.]|uniref:fimbrial biogenesis chaperone n=1 Tax=Nocardioides sp. TaxID=35761 RepID=UPI0031FF387B|nr:pilus assembly protein PilP [Nocardioides sp.]
MQSKTILAALLFLGCFQTGKVKASSLEISPLTVNLLPGQKVTTIEVTNRGGSPVAIQIRAYGWTQQGKEDVLTPTPDLILSPPIFTIPEGVSQTIRLMLRGETAAIDERSYRLLIDEVPSANIDDQQVAIAMRVSLPMIAATASAASRELQWHAKRGPGNQILLSATNPGQTHDKVAEIVVTLPDGTHPKAVASGTNPYVLAGAQRYWVVEDGRVPTGMLRLSVTTKAGNDEHNLAVAP